MNQVTEIVRLMQDNGASREDVLEVLRNFKGSVTQARKTITNKGYGTLNLAMQEVIGNKGNVFSTRDVKDAAEKAGSINPTVAAGNFLTVCLKEGKIVRTSQGHYRTIR